MQITRLERVKRMTCRDVGGFFFVSVVDFLMANLYGILGNPQALDTIIAQTENPYIGKTKLNT